MKQAYFLCLLAVLGRGQTPEIGVIDFYGRHKVNERQIRSQVGVKEGDRLPPSKADIEEKLETLEGVAWAHLEAVCCQEGKAILYVGIEERGAPHFSYRPPPQAEVALPGEITEAYRRFEEALQAAVRKGEAEENLSQGHPLMNNAEARALQEKFIPLAQKHQMVLGRVLRESADAEQRIIATYVLGYLPNKEEAAKALQAGVVDPEDGVRANAVRSLTAIALLNRKEGRTAPPTGATWIVEMLNSILWSDRRRALEALEVLTDDRPAALLQQIRERALPAVIEMARWKVLDHALPAYLILGRLAGIPEEQLRESWEKGERMATIDTAVRSLRAHER